MLYFYLYTLHFPKSLHLAAAVTACRTARSASHRLATCRQPPTVDSVTKSNALVWWTHQREKPRREFDKVMKTVLPGYSMLFSNTAVRLRRGKWRWFGLWRGCQRVRVLGAKVWVAFVCPRLALTLRHPSLVTGVPCRVDLVHWRLLYPACTAAGVDLGVREGCWCSLSSPFPPCHLPQSAHVRGRSVVDV